MQEAVRDREELDKVNRAHAVTVGIITATIILTLVACSPNPPSLTDSGNSDRLSASSSADPALQGFLNTWQKDGVTISETSVGGESHLVAFTDANANGMLDGGEPALADVPGNFSDIPQLASTTNDSHSIKSRCGTLDYEWHPGSYSYRGQTFTLTPSRMTFSGGASCDLWVEISAEPFDGEMWIGLTKGTYRNEPWFHGLFSGPSTTTALIRIPLPTSDDIFDDAYGRDGELAIASKAEGNPDVYPTERMIVGSWKSRVVIN